LWHTAVDGRGLYFSASNPTSVINGLSAALAGVNARVASAAAAATSNLEPVAGDNFAYVAKYVTQKWTGEVEAHEIILQDQFDPVTHALTASAGSISSSVIWSAQAKLDAKGRAACDTRTINLFRAGATNNLTPFTWNTFACDTSGLPTGSSQTSLNATEQANFGATQVSLLSQYPTMTDGTSGSVDQRSQAAGVNLVNFLRGQRGQENFLTNTANQLYRTRDHILGDIINAQPVYVKAPFAQYNDAGYVAFQTANASRTPMVYAAANDGMLHAFYAGTSIIDTNGGNEAWAFIPTPVLPNLYKLASVNYANQHTYSVDGTPTVGDVYDPADTTWKTILVGGLNKGGKGYYAMDVTNPAAPKGLWEFKYSTTCYDAATPSTWYADCHIGYSFGNPIISKLRDGRWVVFVTSGYNNVNSPSVTGDGVGYLYVLEAMTGKILYKISTGVGSAATPSGLNKISAWVEDPTHNNQTERVYGVDLLGNIWRFDVNDILAPPGIEATLLATVTDSTGTAQPITTKPELAEVGGQPFVYVGTGRYLGTTDNSSTQTQSVWAILDPLTATPLTSLRSTLRNMTITNVGSGLTAFRTVACAANCGSTAGWVADFPDSGERVNIDIKLQLGTLVVATNVPQSNACNIGGYSWLNYFDNATGNAVSNSQNASVGSLLVGSDGSKSLAVGLNIVRLPGGKTVVLATNSAAQQLTVSAPFAVAPPTGKRVSWREIIQ
jgi:type IV pilus assembly protein PilY1